MLTNAKELFNENYQNEKIMHMVVKNYSINGKKYLSFKENLDGDHLCVEIEFRSISSNFVSDLERILEKYQIKIIKFMDLNYIKNLFKDDNLEISLMAQKVQEGFNYNEVNLISKNKQKKGFFEKFFQLFS